MTHAEMSAASSWVLVALLFSHVGHLPCGLAFQPPIKLNRLSISPSFVAAAASAPGMEAMQGVGDSQEVELPVVITTLHANKYLEICLNRAKKFNSLNTEMLTIIRDALDEHADEIRGVLLSAVEGRAFCAGGDIKHVSGLGSEEERIRFLHLEYSVHQRLFELNTGGVPVIAVGDGIVMGAGAGLFMAAGIRIVTERTVFAMPEAKIGLLPDAGALYFLNRVCSPGIGLMLALTGRRLNARDLLYAELATEFMPTDAVPGLLRDLALCPAGEHAAVLDRHRDPSLGGKDTLKVLDQGFLEAARASLDEIFGGFLDSAATVEGWGESGGKGDYSSTEGAVEKDSLAALVARLEAKREEGSKAVGSVAWRTREMAEIAVDAAQDALEALRDPTTCPTSIGATVIAFVAARKVLSSQAWSTEVDGSSAEPSPLPARQEAEAMRAIELLINGRLANRADFNEGVSCAVGEKRGSVPTWEAPSSLDALLLPKLARIASESEDGNIERLSGTSSCTFLETLRCSLMSMTTLPIQKGALTLDNARDTLLS